MHVLTKKTHIDLCCSIVNCGCINLQGDSPRAKELAQLISEKMDELERELRAAITRKVAEDFKDPLGPLNALTEAAMAPLGMIEHIVENGLNIFTPLL